MIEDKVNAAIDQNLPVTVEFMTHEEAKDIVDLSKLPADASETLRIIRIGDYDACACIGLHVSNTSEIGIRLFFIPANFWHFFSKKDKYTTIYGITDNGFLKISPILAETLKRFYIMTNSNNYCVIMGGGIGSRFWPYSRKNLPKQFLDFFGTARSQTANV